MNGDLPAPGVYGDNGENTQTRDFAFSALLPDMGLALQNLPELAQRRETFGLAWFCALRLKNQVPKNVPVDLRPCKIDLSGTSGLSHRVLHLFLDVLPFSVEALTLDAVAVKGPALPLLVRFLERLHEQRAAGGTPGEGGPRLKSLTFAEGALGFEEPPVIFPLMLPLLESLCLRGNPLGTGRLSGLRGKDLARPLSEGITEGKAAGVKELDLEKTGLAKEGLEMICEGIKGCEKGPWEVKKLNLSWNRLEDFGGHDVGVAERLVQESAMWSLCPVLSPSFLPHIRVLLLKGCGFSSKTMKCLTDSMGRGDLPNLEVLDLEKNRGGDEFLDVIGGVLRKDAVPQLKDLRFRGNTVSRFPTRKMLKFFQALRSAECPSCLHVSVDLDLSCMPEEIVRGVGAGMYPSLRSLTLVLIEGQLVSFLDGLIQAAEEPKFEVLDLFLRSPPSAAFSLLGEAIQGGRMKSLRRVRCSQSAGNYDDPTEAKITFFTALTQVQLPLCSELRLLCMALTDAHILLLAEAVRAGHLSALRVVDLTRSWAVGADAWGDLMQAIMDCEGGLPKLQKLRLGETKVKEAGGKVAAALGSGQLPSLVSLGMDFDDRDVGPFLFGQEGVDALNEGVRAGRFPSRLREVDFRLKQTHTHTHTHANETSIKLDGLIMAIAEGPVGLPRCVTRLNLRGGEMSVEALACLAARPGGSVSPQRGNGKLSGLKSLNLSRCAIDDERLGRLGEVFCAHVCPRLEFLSLAENKISGAGLTAFFTALSPKSLPKLRRLYLAEQESPLTEDRVQRLQADARFQGKLSKLEDCFDERDLTKQFMDPFTPDRQGSSSESDEPKESRLYLGN